MMDKFDKMLEKKGKKISPVEQKAKRDVLSDLHGQASDMMGDKLAGLKKVSVAAPDKEGLAAGLEKAGELLESEEDEDALSPSPEAAPLPEEAMSVEELDQKIQMLMDLRKEKALQEE